STRRRQHMIRSQPVRTTLTFSSSSTIRNVMARGYLGSPPMDLKDRVIVITGAASGIGEALARRFVDESPRGVVVADLNAESDTAVADRIGAVPFVLNVADPDANRELIETPEDRFGPIDLFCANAGYGIVGDEQTDPAE